MSKYLESVCLWEQNEKYLFSFEGFYVTFACKEKKSSPTGKGVLEVCAQAWSWGRGGEGARRTRRNCGAGLPSAASGPALTQSQRGPAPMLGRCFSLGGWEGVNKCLEDIRVFQ